MTPPVMSVPEVATLLRRSPEYLYSGLREGRFPGTRFGRAWAIPRNFVRGFVTEVIELGEPISFEEFATQWLDRSAA
jgi:excisionase family DNA binding protein